MAEDEGHSWLPLLGTFAVGWAVDRYGPPWLKMLFNLVAIVAVAFTLYIVGSVIGIFPSQGPGTCTAAELELFHDVPSSYELQDGTWVNVGSGTAVCTP